jgi:hypothetical protein
MTLLSLVFLQIVYLINIMTDLVVLVENFQSFIKKKKLSIKNLKWKKNYFKKNIESNSNFNLFLFFYIIFNLYFYFYDNI